MRILLRGLRVAMAAGWRECINRYWDAFYEACMKDIFCKGAMWACGFLCGVGK
ncbi:MAG: hypothetical protein ACP5VE_12275 [Chthonomonadales bacterium]